MDNALYSITKLFNKKFCRLFLVKKECKLPNGIITKKIIISLGVGEIPCKGPK